MKLDQKLVDLALQFLNDRYPDGVGGVAAMYTDDGEILLSTSPEALNECASLCHEVGALCEAYKKNKRVTATVCVSRDDKGARAIILTPCGICQERLLIYGDSVECAVPQVDKPGTWEMRTLGELQPYYWRKVLR